MKKDGFTQCAAKYIAKLKEEGRYSTAHVYKHALRSFTEYCGGADVSFQQINRENLKRYSRYLYERNHRPNTVSTYMRMLRCIYNRGVDAGHTPYIHRLFRGVYTGVDTRQKKALPTGELHALLYKDPKSDKLRKTQAIANLMFLFCGMSFADLARLEKRNLEGNILKYNRVKTGTSMSVEVLDIAHDLLVQLWNSKNYHPDYPDYLCDILSGDKKKKEEGAYIEYQSALRKFNNQLKYLAKACCVQSHVSSYSLRHSWATTAKNCGTPIEMISESLGHKSIKTTQIYLKGFDLERRTEVNKQNYFYVRKFYLRGQ